jgi:hypothetical protein
MHETHTEVATKETGCICLAIASQAPGIIKEIIEPYVILIVLPLRYHASSYN